MKFRFQGYFRMGKTVFFLNFTSKIWTLVIIFTALSIAVGLAHGGEGRLGPKIATGHGKKTPITIWKG